MKRKVLSLLICGAMMSTVLTACGGNKTVEKVDDNTVSVVETENVQTAESTPAVETEETEATETEATEAEAVEETTEEEVVAQDFLSANGLEITPLGNTTVNLAIGAGDAVTDDTEEVSINTMITSNNLGNGYVEEMFSVSFPLSSTGNTYSISAFDRYTGTSFESKASSLGENSGSVNVEGVIVDYDGKQYDCSLRAESGIGDGCENIRVWITHPEEYDGVVFSFGQMTKAQLDAYNAIDFDGTFSVADYSDVFMTGQKYFTMENK